MGAFSRAGIEPPAVSPHSSQDNVNGMTDETEDYGDEIRVEESFILEAWEHGNKAPVTPRLNVDDSRKQEAKEEAKQEEVKQSAQCPSPEPC